MLKKLNKLQLKMLKKSKKVQLKMLYLGKSLVAVDHNLSQGARLSLLFTSILSLFTFLFQTSDIKFEKRRNGEYEQIEIKSSVTGGQPSLFSSFLTSKKQMLLGIGFQFKWHYVKFFRAKQSSVKIILEKFRCYYLFCFLDSAAFSQRLKWISICVTKTGKKEDKQTK